MNCIRETGQGRAAALPTGPGAPPVETFTQRREAAANVHYSSARANLGVGRREAAGVLFERARAEFAQLAREATGREDLRSRVSEIEKDIRRLRR
ncbi:MAG: hypothetical protein ACKV2U_01200 [Bryobacteraceae bacterium]